MVGFDVRANDNACSRQCQNALKASAKYRSTQTCQHCKGTGTAKGEACIRCSGKGSWAKGTISKALGERLLKKYGSYRSGVEKAETIKAQQRRDESNARKEQAQRAEKYNSNRYREIGAGKNRQA